MTHTKTSISCLITLILPQMVQAVKLGSNLTPCAEQALAQIDSAATMNTHCLCYQYATQNIGQLDVEPAPTTVVRQYDWFSLLDYTTLASNINDKGGLVTAIDGKCVDQTYVIKGRMADTRVAPDITDSCFILGVIS